MASAQTIDKLATNLHVTMYDHDPADSTVATDVTWVDMRDYDSIMILVFSSALTGTGTTAFSILANTASDGTGSETTVVAHAVGSAPDAVGDWLMLECTAEQIGALGDDNGYALRYVSANVTMNNAADEAVVVYIRKPKRAYDGLTADYVS